MITMIARTTNITFIGVVSFDPGSYAPDNFRVTATRSESLDGELVSAEPLDWAAGSPALQTSSAKYPASLADRLDPGRVLGSVRALRSRQPRRTATGRSGGSDHPRGRLSQDAVLRSQCLRWRAERASADSASPPRRRRVCADSGGCRLPAGAGGPGSVAFLH
jgi:hypothetical protein